MHPCGCVVALFVQMIFAFPLLVLAATLLALRHAGRDAASGGTDWRWFAAWTAAGAALAFSFVTGFSIGLLVLPVAAALLLWVARHAPHRADALGFVEGIAVLLLLIAFLNRGGSGVDPTPWLVAGLSLGASAVCVYVLLRRRRPGTRG
jgi:hypothetical protein